MWFVLRDLLCLLCTSKSHSPWFFWLGLLFLSLLQSKDENNQWQSYLLISYCVWLVMLTEQEDLMYPIIGCCLENSGRDFHVSITFPNSKSYIDRLSSIFWSLLVTRSQNILWRAGFAVMQRITGTGKYRIQLLRARKPAIMVYMLNLQGPSLNSSCFADSGAKAGNSFGV